MVDSREEPDERRGFGSDSQPNHARIVADADVLAAALLVGGPSREVLELIRRHGWLELVATDRLLEDAAAVVARLADDELASAWHEECEALAVRVKQPADDHPALAAAYRGGAVHLLTLDERLQSADAGARLRGVMDVSVRSPHAFVTVFDPASAYELAFDEPYPGPNADPSG